MSKKNTLSVPLAEFPEEARKQFFEHTPNLLCVIGSDQKFKLFNPAWSQVLGWSKDELLKLAFLDLVHPDDLEETKAVAFKRQDTKRTTSSFQNRCRCKDGSYRWLLWYDIPSPENQEFYGIARDITDHKQAEEELRREKDFTDIALNSQIDTFFLFNPETGKALRWNQAFSDITGYSDQEIANQKAPDTYYSPEDLKKAALATEEVLKTGSGTVELDLICKDGRRIPTEYKASVIRDNAGNPKHLISVGRDISKRKLVEKALKESEEKYRGLIEQANDGIVIVQDGKIIFTNGKLYRMLGYSQEDLLNTEFLSYVAPGDRDRIADFHIRRFKGEDVPNIYEMTVIRKDGTSIPIEANSRVITYQGKPSVLAFIRDISERKAAEEALKESEERYRSLSRATSEGIAITEDGVFIDINDQLLSMMGYEKDDLIGKKITDFVIPEDHHTVEERVSEKREDLNEVQVICKDGHLISVEARPRVIEIEGRVLRLTAIRDVTERKQAEEALRKSEDQYKSTLNNLSIGVVVHDADTSILISNPEANKILGLTSDQISGKKSTDTVWNFVHDDGRKMKIKDYPVNQAISKKEPLKDYITGIIKPDTDHVTWVNVSALPIFSDSNQIEKVIVNFVDITERKQAEEALQESEEKFRNIVESSPMGMHMYQLESDDRLVFSGANPAADTILGVDNNLFVGKTIEQAFPPLADTEVPQRYRDAAAEGTPWYTEQITYQDEHIVGAFEVHAFQTSPGRMTALFLDITERKQAEEALQESEEKFRNIVEASPMGMHMYSLESDGRFVFIGANPAADNILGLDNSQFIGKTIEESFPSSAETELIERYRKAAAEGDPWFIEQNTYEDDKISGSFEVHAFQTSPGKMTALFLDITERKQAEEEIRKLNDELEQRVANRTAELEATNQELEAFAYSISHDLRAPLRAINSFSQILQQEYEQALDEEGKGYLSRVQISAKRMNKLIDDLLALSRLGREDMSLKTAKLDRIAKRVFKEITKQEPDRKIDFQIKDIPPVTVDPSLIEVVITNLLGNAVKFTRNKKISKIVFGVKKSADGPIFYIKDNGVGFEMEYADKLFSPFQRLHTDSEFEGTGIGLAIVHRIIQRHGGEIWVDSKPGKGTTFFFTLKSNESRN
jgi:PAS domain S-box-containing protein